MTKCFKSHIFLRVSREDLDEQSQLIEILKVFNLKEKDCVVIREKISAYKEEVQYKREAFIRLKALIEAREVKDVYVYSLERFERNIIRLFEFFFFCEANECRVHGALQLALELDYETSPMGTFSRYQQVLLWGLLAENESYTISKRTKKTIVRSGHDITKSTYGKKWGSSLLYPDSKRVSMKVQEKLNTQLKSMIKKHTKLGRKFYYPLIIQDIDKEFGVKISKSYITKIKQTS